ncbi:MAG: 16S rRNA (guanine(527)-N(7))-methyltransferase RsmG [Blastocatellia bacterium]|nr:16S rRNA (guanine(527)-N(7))-methyltransferase RsmG [Blastocatellia bacterium]
MNDEGDTEFRSALESTLTDLGLEALTDAQTRLLVRHFRMLRQWNRRVNLTRIIEPNLAAKLHYGESLFGGRFIGGASVLLDIGAGAGFPSIPIAIIRPDLRVTALEANQKKALFLNEVKDALGLANFEVARARLEEFDWSDYDLLTSRALDRSESVFPRIIRSLGANQRLMLYCAPDLLASLISSPTVREGLVETHAVPHTESRLIAIFSGERSDES